MTWSHLASLGVVTLSLHLGGCGRAGEATEAKSEHAEKDHHHHEDEGGEGSGVAFHPGEGLELSAGAAAALGLRTARVEERKIDEVIRVLAQVFATEPKVLASVALPEADAARWESAQLDQGHLVRVDRSSLPATGRVELIFSIEKTPVPQSGAFVELTARGTARLFPVISESALLDTAQGAFVYVVTGEHYTRVPVKIGGRADGFVAIAEGLSAGATVVTAPVEQLWLTELRLTKGGGHSH